jgi:hypothetical protein
MFGMRVSLHATWASFSSRPRYFQSERRLRRLRQWTEFITAASVQGTLRAITILATAVVPRATWANFSSRPRTLQTIRRLMRLRRPRTLQPIRRLMRLRRWTGALATVSVQDTLPRHQHSFGECCTSLCCIVQRWLSFQDKHGIFSPSADNDVCGHACKTRCRAINTRSASAVYPRAALAIFPRQTRSLQPKHRQRRLLPRVQGTLLFGERGAASCGNCQHFKPPSALQPEPMWAFNTPKSDSDVCGTNVVIRKPPIAAANDGHASRIRFIRFSKSIPDSNRHRFWRYGLTMTIYQQCHNQGSRLMQRFCCIGYIDPPINLSIRFVVSSSLTSMLYDAYG